MHVQLLNATICSQLASVIDPANFGADCAHVLPWSTGEASTYFSSPLQGTYSVTHAFEVHLYLIVCVYITYEKHVQSVRSRSSTSPVQTQSLGYPTAESTRRHLVHCTVPNARKWWLVVLLCMYSCCYSDANNLAIDASGTAGSPNEDVNSLLFRFIVIAFGL